MIINWVASEQRRFDFLQITNAYQIQFSNSSLGRCTCYKKKMLCERSCSLECVPVLFALFPHIGFLYHWSQAKNHFVWCIFLCATNTMKLLLSRLEQTNYFFLLWCRRWNSPSNELLFLNQKFYKSAMYGLFRIQPYLVLRKTQMLLLQSTENKSNWNKILFICGH